MLPNSELNHCAAKADMRQGGDPAEGEDEEDKNQSWGFGPTRSPSRAEPRMEKAKYVYFALITDIVVDNLLIICFLHFH